MLQIKSLSFCPAVRVILAAAFRHVFLSFFLVAQVEGDRAVDLFEAQRRGARGGGLLR
jgi:hypothetical protein